MGIIDGVLDIGKKVFSGVGDILGGIGSTGANVLGTVGGFLGQERANQMNMDIAQFNSAQNFAEAQRNRDFQHFMSDTAWQRAVTDMKHAGLNPMLAYSQGPAQSMPGSMGQAVQPAQMLNSVAAGLNAAQQAAQVKALDATAERTKAETDNIRATLPKIGWETKLTEQQVDYVKNQAREMMERIYETYWKGSLQEQRVKLGEVEHAVALLVSENRAVTARAVLDELESPRGQAYADYYKSEMGKLEPFIQSGTKALGSLVGSASEARRAFRAPPTIKLPPYGRRRAPE